MRLTAVLIGLFSFISTMAQLSGQNTFQRKGLVLGGAAGISSIRMSTPSHADEHQMGLSLPNLKIGYMVSPRTALLVYLPGTVYSFNQEGRERDRGFEGILPSVQYWAGDRLWLLAGVGLGLDAPAFYDIKEASERKFYFGSAALAGLGYEFWRKRRFALDVQGRLHYGNAKLPEGKRDGLAFSLLLGFNFY